jgi:hypothetical protein
MTNASWHVSGEYFESCSCDYLCPCIYTNLSGKPTQGHCDVAMVFHIEHGHAGDVSLDDVNFAVVAHTPGVMGEGNWTVGLIIDERAADDQANAIAGIASGQAGGPMAALGALISNFAGIERKAIEFRKDSMSRSASVPGMLEETVQGYPSPVREGEPIYLDNTLHPASSRLALATASDSHVHVFGIDWDDTSGKNNAHYAPFDWRG